MSTTMVSALPMPYPRAMAPDEPTDEELMLAYAGGDMLAFETLYRRHRGALYRFLLRTLRQRADADELFQETWSRVIVARERYRPEAKFTTWLLQIAHNLAIDRFRRNQPIVESAIVLAPMSETAGNETTGNETAGKTA